MWLAVSVATWWLLRVGGAAEATRPGSTLLDVTRVCPARPRTRRATRLRLVSVFRQGWVRLLGALRRQDPWPQGRCVPEPWPVVPPLLAEVCELALALPEAACGAREEQLRQLGKKRRHSQHLMKKPPPQRRAGGPWTTGGSGRSCHCRPGASPPRRTGTRRCEPRGPCGPGGGRARGGQSKARHAMAESGPGSGVVAAGVPWALLGHGPHAQLVEATSSSRVRHTLQKRRPIYKTRNQLIGCVAPCSQNGNILLAFKTILW